MKRFGSVYFFHARICYFNLGWHYKHPNLFIPSGWKLQPRATRGNTCASMENLCQWSAAAAATAAAVAVALAYSLVAAGAFPEVLMLRCCSWLPGGALLLLLVLLGGALLLLLVLTWVVSAAPLIYISSNLLLVSGPPLWEARHWYLSIKSCALNALWR